MVRTHIRKLRSLAILLSVLCAVGLTTTAFGFSPERTEKARISDLDLGLNHSMDFRADSPANIGQLSGVAAQQTSGFDLVSQLGGFSQAIALKGTLAYLGVGPSLTILDISTPAHLKVVGQAGVASHLGLASGMYQRIVNDITVVGDYAYIIEYYSGLYIFNIADPTQPRFVSYTSLGLFGYDVAVAGTYAYIANDYGLKILDISNPAAPTEIGHIPGSATAVKVLGNYIYVIGGNLVSIFDVSDLTAPVQMGWFNTPGIINNLALEGNYAYAVVGYGCSCLQIIDVSDLTTPIPLGHLYLPEDPYDIVVSGHYAYIADLGAGLRILDIADPMNPVAIGAYDTPRFAYDLKVAGSYAYVADLDAGLRIINVGNPAAPAEAGFYNPPDRIWDLVVRGNDVYAAAYYEGLKIVDVSNEALPVVVGNYPTLGYARKVVVTRTVAYVASGFGSNGLSIVDISDLTAPIIGGTYDMNGVNDLVISGTYAYVAHDYPGLAILDVSDPAAISQIGVHDTPGGNAVDVAVSGDRVFLADSSNGLRIIDVSNPATPTQLGSYTAAASIDQVALFGNNAYVIDGDGNLRIIDVSNPASPTQIGFYDPAWDIVNFTVAGGYVYIAAGDNGLQIIDATTPDALIEIGSYTALVYAQTVVLSDDLAYIGDTYPGLRGLTILRLKPWLLPPDVASVSVTGGLMRSSHDQTSYIFPNGIFTDTVIVTHAARNPVTAPSHSNLIGIDHFFEVTAVYSSTGLPAQPTQPYTLTVQYTDQEKGPAIENTLGLYYWNGLQWVNEPSSVVDAANNTVTATPDHFGRFAVLGETNRIFLSGVLKNR